MEKKTQENIKTGLIVILGLVVVFGGSFFASEFSGKAGTYNENTAASSSEEMEPETISEDEQKDLNEIGLDEYLSLKDGEEKSIIFIARPTCHYCQLYEPIMKNMVYLYDLKVNHLNTDELSDEEQNKLIKSDDYFSEGYGTPLTLIVQNGKILDKIEGYTTSENTIQFLKDNGFISE